MPGNLSDYLENRLLDHTLGTAAYAHPADVYLGLFTAAPTDAGGGTEVPTAGGTNYARQAVTFSAASGGAATNSAEVAFPVAGASYGGSGVVAVGLFDSASGGNLLWHGPTAATTAIGVNDQYKIPAGDLDVSLD